MAEPNLRRANVPTSKLCSSSLQVDQQLRPHFRTAVMKPGPKSDVAPEQAVQPILTCVTGFTYSMVANQRRFTKTVDLSVDNA